MASETVPMEVVRERSTGPEDSRSGRRDGEPDRGSVEEVHRGGIEVDLPTARPRLDVDGRP